MNTQHTPGPWYWSDNVPDFPKNHCIIVDADGFTIAEPSPMSEADARLIANAPALLHALQMIDSNAAESVEWIRRVARAAIARATGENA